MKRLCMCNMLHLIGGLIAFSTVMYTILCYLDQSGENVNPKTDLRIENLYLHGKDMEEALTMTRSMNAASAESNLGDLSKQAGTEFSDNALKKITSADSANTRMNIKNQYLTNTSKKYVYRDILRDKNNKSKKTVVIGNLTRSPNETTFSYLENAKRQRNREVRRHDNKTLLTDVRRNPGKKLGLGSVKSGPKKLTIVQLRKVDRVAANISYSQTWPTEVRKNTLRLEVNEKLPESEIPHDIVDLTFVDDNNDN